MGANLLRKALDAVQLVALRGELTVREIGEVMGMPKSTAHRLVANLVEVRLLQAHRGADGDVFALGTLMHELAGGQLFWRTLVQHAQPQMLAVRDDTEETVGLHVLFAERRLLVEQVVSHHPHRWVYNNHMVPMPLHAGAAAKMLLAMLPEQDMRRLAKRDHPLAVAKGRPRDLDGFLQDLSEIRRRSYSLSSHEVNPGISSIAVPVIGDASSGYPLAVMSLAGPSIRFTEKAMKRSLQRLRRAAAAIADELRTSTGVAPVRDQVTWNGRQKETNPAAVGRSA